MKEITIEISSEMENEISIHGGLPFDMGQMIDIKIGANSSSNGKCQLHIIFPEVDCLEKLVKLKNLYDTGVLTQSEFEAAKANVIASI